MMGTFTLVRTNAFIIILFLGVCVFETSGAFVPFIIRSGFPWYEETYLNYSWALGVYEETTSYPRAKYDDPTTYEFRCGAVWLTRTTVLTSADCVFHQKVRDTRMYVGNFDDKAVIKFAIAHPGYKASTQKNNIAILHMEEVWRVEDPLLKNLSGNGNLEARGDWPAFEPDFAEFSDADFDTKVENGEVECAIIAANETDPYLFMMASPTQFFDSRNCAKQLKRKGNPKKVKNFAKKMSDKMHICTRDSSQENELCDAAPGWVLGCYDNDEAGTFKLVGIMFQNQKRCSNKPNVYTRVSMYTKWIDDMIQVDRYAFLNNRYPASPGGGGDP